MGFFFNKKPPIRTQAFSTLQKEHDLWGAIIASMGEGVVVVDLSYNVILINQTAGALLRVSPYECEGKDLLSLLTFLEASDGEHSTEITENILERAIKSIDIIIRGPKDNYFCRNRLGTIFPVSLTAAPLFGVSGVSGAVVVFRDITGEKQLMDELIKTKASIERTVVERTKELAEAKSKEEALLESIGDCIVATDVRGIITFVNHVAVGMIGLPEKEIVGKLFTDIWDVIDEKGNSVPVNDPTIMEPLQKNQRIEADDGYFVVKHTNYKFPAAVIVSPVFYNDALTGSVVAIRDITKEKELDRAKSDFVSIASHQLRTPLSSIRWVLDVLREEKLTKKQREYVDNVYSSNQRLVNLVDDLLNTSRIEAGTLKSNRTSVVLQDSITNLVNTLKPSADEKKQTIKLTVPKKKTTITIDINPFEMAFNNLLSNAINYSPPELPITITVDVKDGNCLVSVNNLKPIISPTDQTKLFTKFFRAEDAKKIRPEGTGLGVFIAKSAVEKSGGKMWFTSQEPEGTTFSFSIPVK